MGRKQFQMAFHFYEALTYLNLAVNKGEPEAIVRIKEFENTDPHLFRS